MTRHRQRIACIDIPAFPLQLVLREHPDWHGDPVVIVDADKATSEILWTNRQAQRHRICRGMEFRHAQAVTTTLHAAVVEPTEISDAVDELLVALLAFSPRVEPSRDWPGLFWLDPSGLDPLFGNLEAWATQVHQLFVHRHLITTLIVGFERHSTFAIARTTTGPHVLKSPSEEKQLAARVKLSQLNISTDLLNSTAALGIHTLDAFMRLPAHAWQIRYGEEAARLHRLTSGDSWAPLQPEVPSEPVHAEMQVEPPDINSTRLLFGIKRLLHDIVGQLSPRCEAITALELTFCLERAPAHHERIETAKPTVDIAQIIELIRLRLSREQLAAPVELITIIARSIRVWHRQAELPTGKKRRDLRAGDRALARIKAAFGARAVTYAQIKAAHLPEAKFRWRELSEVQCPTLPAGEYDTDLLPLIRRIHPRSVVLPPIPVHEPEAWLPHKGAVLQMFGPSRISGGWWRRRIERDYYFVETRLGEILWLYYDQVRRRWFEQGSVD